MTYINEVLRHPRTLERGYFEPAYVEKVLSEHADGRVNHRLLIWSMLSFEWWNRLFIDGDRTERHGDWRSQQRAVPYREGQS